MCLGVLYMYSNREKRIIMFNQSTVVKNFKVDQFDVEVSWAYENESVRDFYDETEEDFVEMERRLGAGIDTHYMAVVRVSYDDKLMGLSSLGSCYALDCSPEEDINNGIGGYLADMVDEAVDEARDEAAAMIDRLKADFLS